MCHASLDGDNARVTPDRIGYINDGNTQDFRKRIQCQSCTKLKPPHLSQRQIQMRRNKLIQKLIQLVLLNIPIPVLIIMLPDLDKIRRRQILKRLLHSIVGVLAFARLQKSSQKIMHLTFRHFRLRLCCVVSLARFRDATREARGAGGNTNTKMCLGARSSRHSGIVALAGVHVGRERAVQLG